MDKLSKEQILKSLGLFAQVKTHRFFYKASGFTDEELERPIIAIANSMQDAGIGHVHLKTLADAVKAGVYLAGGTPVEFNTIGPCGGYCKDGSLDPTLLLYDLPQRDVIADSVEIQVRNLGADGVVMMGTCDKSVPGLWLAGARLNLPTIFYTGGPAEPGMFEGRPTTFPTDVILEGVNRTLSGRMSEEEFRKTMYDMEDKWVASCGACPELTTANTVQMATEVMGLTLPGVSTTSGGDLMRRTRLAKQTGYAAVGLIKQDKRFRDFVTAPAIEDALRLIMAVSASTNGVLHLLALAYTLGLDVGLDTVSKVSDRTPYIVPVRPSGPFTMIDLHNAGGPMAVLKRIERDVDTGRPTVTGETIGERLGKVRVRDERVILPVEKAVSPFGGIVVMKGNIAPNGALARYTIVKEENRHFTGRARCFDQEQLAIFAILNGDIQSGDVIVLRYQGPRGGPGFAENFRTVLILGSLGLHDVAVITDSRFSGATTGALYVGYISPEAQVGGPIAILRDGDGITIDVDRREVSAALTGEEIRQRLSSWRPPDAKVKEGVLVQWYLSAEQFETGAMLPRRLR
ncbi:MAG: dihydroxy-acid dehydratase [Deltaproteobacteria bacterium]|nr:dihydroxy-acid dehydratase [Deltaproteobacteria bacterium]